MKKIFLLATIISTLLLTGCESPKIEYPEIHEYSGYENLTVIVNPSYMILKGYEKVEEDDDTVKVILEFKKKKSE